MMEYVFVALRYYDNGVTEADYDPLQPTSQKTGENELIVTPAHQVQARKFSGEGRHFGRHWS
jgi:hypothetical protein